MPVCRGAEHRTISTSRWRTAGLFSISSPLGGCSGRFSRATIAALELVSGLRRGDGVPGGENGYEPDSEIAGDLRRPAVFDERFVENQSGLALAPPGSLLLKRKTTALEDSNGH